MASGGNDGGMPMAEINVTPMVDVLLVLLIIFMITAPTLHHDIQIDLPQPNKDKKQQENPPEPIELRINAAGTMTWNNTPVTDAALKAQLLILGAKPLKQQSELRIQADADTQYAILAKLMAKAKNAGVQKIGFQK